VGRVTGMPAPGEGWGMARRVAVILAAGEGTRMKSALPKVLHEVDGRPMVAHVLDLARRVDLGRPIVVVGHGRGEVRVAVEGRWDCQFVLQPVQRGTGDAVSRAMETLTTFHGTVVVLSGDVPLLKTETVQGLMADHERERRGVTLLTAELEDPGGYGRIVRSAGGQVLAIVEEKDATPEERRIREINSGTYCFDADGLRRVLAAIDTDNRQREFYLTDTVHLMRCQGVPVGAVVAPEAVEVLGVNTPDELERARALLRARARDDGREA